MQFCYANGDEDVPFTLGNSNVTILNRFTTSSPSPRW